MDRSTGKTIGNLNSKSCLCKRIEYYTNFSVCLPCPEGADCSERDGLNVTELTANAGYWRPNLHSNIFSPCSKGHRGLNAETIAKQLCCPYDVLTNHSICKTLNFTNPDSQCKIGYGGPLCFLCADGYVSMGGECILCYGGSSFGIAMLPMTGACTLLFLLVVVILVCKQGKNDKKKMKLMRTKTRVEIKRFKRMRRAHKAIGQLKILLSFFQVVSAMPSVMDSVPWPNIFLKMALPLGVFDFDFVAAVGKTSCGVSVSFYDRFLIHMMLPFGVVVAIVAAALVARICTHASEVDKLVEIKVTTSKAFILAVLLLFPGLSTKIFQMFKCQQIDGIEGALLVQDFSVTCNQGDHVMYTMLAMTFCFLYILGIPAFMFLLLWRNRKHLHDEDSPNHYWIKTALGGLYVQCEYKLARNYDYSLVQIVITSFFLLKFLF